ncbi:hypothetical protein [Clostridium vincentii]|uniref:Uncharacterized protein n=1 Tax=Clostridium vincentii TaxID=52704 RepID=A0A2T0BGC6_9CLOT|nr:hypothetical protein [Clostridium vincentii]PRR82945.1 hypothetical protein CLVI_13880 [Clostridium vincentii]
MIEIVIAIGVLSIISIFAISTCRLLIINTTNRISTHKMNESIYGVSSEIKYNIQYDDLVNALKYENITMKYGDGFLYKLATIELLSSEVKAYEDKKLDIKLLNRGTYNEDKILDIKIEISYKGENIEKTVTKAPWMEYV